MHHFSLDQATATGDLEASEARAQAVSAVDQSATADLGHPWPITLLVISAIGLIAAIVLCTVILVSNFRNRALGDSERELSNITLVLAEQADRAFQAVELVQTSLIDRMKALGINSSEEYERQMSGHDVHLMLKDKISGLPHVDAVTMINAQGKLINFSRYWPIPTVNVTDRDYFKALKSDARLNFFVSEPVRNRGTGTWTIYLARKFTGSNGDFLGLVLGAMELQYFEKFFGAIALEPGSSIALFRRDGILLARHPHVDPLIGRSYGSNALFLKLLANSNHGVGRQTGVVDGEDRIIAAHAVTNFPIAVTATTTTSAALSNWQKEAKLLIGVGILAAFVIAVVISLIARQLLRRQRRSQQALREQKLLLDRALDNMSQGLLMYDSRERVILCNNRYLELYGVPPAMVARGCTRRELIEHHYAVGLFSGDAERYISNTLREAVKDRPYSKTLETTDGRAIAVINRPIEGGISVSTHEDITGMKRRDASFRLLFENNPLPMFVYDLAGLRFLAVNDAAVAQFGYNREQFFSMAVQDIWPATDRDRYAGAVQTWEDSHSEEVWHYQRSDGSKFEAAIYSRALHYEGRMGRFVAVIDMTERRRAEQERDRNRDFLDRVIENVPATIFVKDARDRRYVLINQAAEKLLAMPRSEVIGRKSDDIFPKETADLIAEHDRQLMQSDSPLCVPEHTIQTPRNGARLVRSTRLSIRDQHGQPQYLLGVLEDVTERRAVQEQLQQAQKMEAVGQLTGGLAHDFNNLLLIIIGNLDLLKDRFIDDPDTVQIVDATLEAGLRGADLTRQMLAFSRRQPLRPKRIKVGDLIRHTTQLLSRTLGEQIKVNLQTAADLWPVQADEAQLEAALVNIAINARDAMPSGGTLIIGTGNAHLGADYAARHPDVRPGDYVLIEVSDTGAGMTPDVLARAFDPFFTTKAPGEGTGLGLSMVYGFMKQSGGHVSAYSEVGKGTTFRLYLPRAALSEAELKQNGAMSEPVARARGEVILAVDDNSGVRATVVKQLKELGYQVLEADNAQAALEVLDSGGTIDLLFTDMVMPGGVDGKELARRARNKRPNLKVLFTSGFPGTLLCNGPELDVGSALLSKPYRKHVLASTIREILADSGQPPTQMASEALRLQS